MRTSVFDVVSRAAPASKSDSRRPARFVAVFLVAALTTLPLVAFGQVDYNAEDAKRIKSAEVVGALGDDLFGE